MKTKKNKYCGYVTIVGRSNVGKSTLLNQLIGKKISIESRKKNTTQRNIIGIKTNENYQFIYIDTPGINVFKDNKKKEKKFNYFHYQIKNSILIIFLTDKVFWTSNDEIILNILQKKDIPIIVGINKVDIISNKKNLLPYISFLKKKINPAEIIPLSAKKKENITFLEQIIKKYLPKKEHIFSSDCITTHSKFFLISEIIRKSLISSLGDELPYIVKVKVKSINVTKKNETHIQSVIYVNNIRQKKIIIGHHGEKIKYISISSRLKIEKMLYQKVHLFLWIKINL